MRSWLLLALIPGAAEALEPFPKQLTLPKPVIIENSDEVFVETYGFLSIEDDGAAPRQIAGRHVRGRLIMRPDPQWDGEKTWANLREGLTPNGWKVHSERQGNVYWATVVYEKAGAEIWCIYAARASDGIDLECVEKGGPAIKLELGIPGPKPERITDDGDFPWLSRFPGAELSSTSRDDGLFDISDTDQPEFLSGGSITKEYEGPGGLSPAGFVYVYKAALQKVGWKILRETTDANHARMLAHYGKGGRDLWAMFRIEAGAYSVKAQDLSWTLRADALKRGMDKTCRATIYGVRFDPATNHIAPESVGLLERIAELIIENPGIQLEIQGHGEASGPLAEAVRAWLVAHGIRGERVSAKGYGLTMTVESNDTPDGKALNRRLEILKKGCAP
ncbi:MAG: OmpA family protein [Myxococcota bacterium]